MYKQKAPIHCINFFISGEGMTTQDVHNENNNNEENDLKGMVLNIQDISASTVWSFVFVLKLNHDELYCVIALEL